MTSYDFDLFTIGAGSGGVRASRIAAGHGAKVAVAEEFRVGGTCVIRGCVPKKMLVYASGFAEELSHAARFGWHVEGMRFDWATLRDFVARDVDRLEGLYGQTLDSHKVDRFMARAVVTGPNSVSLADGRSFTAQHILIAVGATPVMPAIPGGDLCISSNEIFHLTEFPQRLVVVGGGYIALEFAGIFNALGAEVTVVNRSDVVLRGYDRVCVERLTAIMAARGVRFVMDAHLHKVERHDDGSLLAEVGGETLAADQVLVATGRRPNTDGLGLESAGIALGPRGEVPVDAYGATSCPSIHAVGDVTDRVQLTPVAIREGHALADTLFGGTPRATGYDHIPSAVFTQPPLATVGLTEDQARALHRRIKVYSSDFRPMKNLYSPLAERGLYRMVVDEDSGKVLGLHMLGPDSAEILQAAAIAIRAGLTKADFDATVALHPSMAEELVLMR